MQAGNGTVGSQVSVATKTEIIGSDAKSAYGDAVGSYAGIAYSQSFVSYAGIAYTDITRTYTGISCVKT